jgi:UDP-N-acetyl-D-glucosamine dehydrogenase
MMKNYDLLMAKITKKRARICILGLGYVGLPLAVGFAKKGFKVIGYDPNQRRIDHLLKGEKYITDIEAEEPKALIDKGLFLPTADAKVLNECDVYIICVPTPLRQIKTPDMRYIVSASRVIKKHLKVPSLVILESTTYPGTSREVIMPALEKGGLKAEEDFFLCFSPERVDPGNKKFPVNKIPKIVGGLSERSTRLAKALYGQVMKTVVEVSSIETAETVKLLENTFRLVNIGLVNEFALLCNKLGISVWEVIEGAKTKPFGFMPFYPGPGLGGHCIPCDPVYLSWKARKVGFRTKMIDLAAETNRAMPGYVVERVRQLLKKNSLRKASVMLIGVTYKRDVKDLRESPALDIIDILHDEGVVVSYFDPLVPFVELGDIHMQSSKLAKQTLTAADCVVIVTDHSDVDYDFIRRHARLVFDTRNVYKDSHDNVVKL